MYKVYQPHSGNAVLSVNTTPKQIDFVGIGEDLTYSLHKMRIMEFHKEYTIIDYSPALFAYRVLTSANIPATPEVVAKMKGIIMETASVIVVTPNAEFIGRFVDVPTASAVCDENSIVIQSAADMEQFTKALLLAQLPEGNDGKKAELAELLYNQYVTAEVVIPEPKSKRSKKSNEAKARREKSDTSVNARIRTALLAGESVVLEDIAAAAEKSIATARTQLNTIRNAKDDSKIDITSGHIDGKLVYVATEFVANFTFDAKTERAPRATGTGEGRVPKTDGPVYKVHEYCNANPDAARKDVIAALVELGINKATATTQYGKWKAANKAPAAPAENNEENA